MEHLRHLDQKDNSNQYKQLPNKNKVTQEKWDCNHCSLYFLTQEKLNEHKQRHNVQLIDDTVKCKYCNKVIFNSAKNKVCYANRKCETCEYRCSLCPKRFLRYSSLINHERNHKMLKKNKKNPKDTSKTVDCHTQKNGTVQRKSLGVPLINKQNGKTQKKGVVKRMSLDLMYEKGENNKVSLHKISRKKQKVPILEENINSVNIKTSKTKLGKNVAVSDSEIPLVTHKIKIEPESSSTSNIISTSNESLVNYKPFSCHVCGDTFASDCALINHIKVHGENALTTFKCKYCGDEFDDIYKMQFHLAICPLAEDELESTITQTIPIQCSTNKTNDIFSPDAKLSRKKRRESKISRANTDTLIEIRNDKATPSQSTRSQRKKNDVRNLATNPVLDCVSPSLKPELNTKSNIVVFNEKNEFQHSYEEFLNNDPEEDPLEHIEINFAPENVSPEQTFNVNKDHRVKEHICPFPRCSMKFSREKALLCHMRNHSDDFDDTLKCHKCDIPFDDIHSLRLHIDECKGIKEEKDDDFNQPDYLSSKTKNRFSPQSRNELLCKVCGRTYKTLEKLNRHVLRHRSTNFMCRICEQVFNNQLLLDKHILDKHPIKSPYHCEICNEDFISELFLQIHKSDYHSEVVNKTPNVQDIPLSRKPTSKRPSTRLKILKRHNYSNTIVSYRFTGKQKNNCWCPVCYEKFNERASLRSHLHHHHIDKNKSMYICEVCEVTKPNAEMLCCHLEMHSFNLLSVNRFCKLRGCIDSGSQVSSSKVNKSWIKSENLSDNEEKVEIKQEVPDDVAPKRTSRKGSKRKSESKIGTTLTRSLSNSAIRDSFTTQLVEDLSPQLKTRQGGRKRKNTLTPLKSKRGKDAVDFIESCFEENFKSDTLTINQTMVETKKAKNTQSKFKSKSKGRKKSRSKGKRKNEFKKKLGECTSKESLLNEIAVDLKNMIPENGLSRKKGGLPPIYDDIRMINNEEGNKDSVNNYNEDEHQSYTTDKTCSTQRKHLKCNAKNSHIESVTNDNELESLSEERLGLDSHIVVSYESTTDKTITDHAQLLALTSPVDEELRSFRSECEDEDEIHCTMCSLAFRNQDDLLDHVGTHI